MSRKKLLTRMKYAGYTWFVFQILYITYTTYQYVTYEPIPYVVMEVLGVEGNTYDVKMVSTKDNKEITTSITTDDQVGEGYEYLKKDAPWYIYILLMTTSLLITYLLYVASIIPINRELATIKANESRYL